MSVELALSGLAVLMAGAALALLRLRKPPRYLVTVQKVTNATEQPETVTVQLNLPASATPAELWEEMEKVAAASTARMTTINESILEVNRKIAEEIQQRRIDRIPVIRGELAERRRRRISKELGVPPDEVDAILQKHNAEHLMDRAADQEAAR